MTDAEIHHIAGAVLKSAAEKGIMIATAESCTGGLVAAALTDIAGSSTVFERGFVTYSNEAKTELVGVPADLVARHGAVSGEVASAMAQGAITHSRAQLAVAVTGVAGPGGGSPQKPVGLVWFGLAMQGREPATSKRLFADNGRSFIRRAAVAEALGLLQQALSAE